MSFNAYSNHKSIVCTLGSICTAISPSNIREESLRSDEAYIIFHGDPEGSRKAAEDFTAPWWGLGNKSSRMESLVTGEHRKDSYTGSLR